MKTITLIVALLICFPELLPAQNDTMMFRRFYHAWIFPVYGRQVKHGILLEVKDSSILLTSSAKKKHLHNGNFIINEIKSDRIQNVVVQSSKLYSKGKMVGAISGVCAGIAIGASQFARWNDYNSFSSREGQNFENAVEVFGFILITCMSTASGIGIGAIADQIAKKRIRIKGDQDWYDAAKPELMRLSLLKITGDSLMALEYVKRLPDSVTDIDGNKYSMNALGGMVWLGENLRTTRYANGDTIPLVYGNEEWRMLTTGAYCNVTDRISIIRKLGRLYNRAAVMDRRNVCPKGWHVPMYNDWLSLVSFFGGENVAAPGLRGYGTRLEFANLAGYRSNDGDIIQPGLTGRFWWSDRHEQEMTIGLVISKPEKNVSYTGKEKGAGMGMSVRCVRDF